MLQPNRRLFLGSIGAGVLAGRSMAFGSPPVGGQGDPAELVDLIRKTPRAELLTDAVALHAQGVHWRDLLAAAFLAGIRDVEPRPVGYQFHCVMMTNSAFDIAARSPAADRLAVALYNIDDFKLSQERDAKAGDWLLGEAQPTDEIDVRAATARLWEAMEARDADQADRAVVDLAHCGTADQVFEPFWWFGMRDFTNIGHNPIFTAQAYRTLQQIGWRHGRDVVRSLAYGLLDRTRQGGAATFDANRERVVGMEWPRAGSGSHSAQASLDLVIELRSATPDQAAVAAKEALSSGLSQASFWEGLRLFAAEQMWRDPGILAVHALTSVNALRHISVRATRPETRAMAILQAASWQVLYRDYLSARPAYDDALGGIETFEPSADQLDVTELFDVANADPRSAAGLAMCASPEDVLELMGAARHWLVRKVREHHDYKYAAALLEEMQLAQPETARRMFAASLGYLRKPQDRDHPLWACLENGKAVRGRSR